MIKVLNTLTGRKEDLIPVKEGQVGMYVCGVTVYDDCHIGHGRAYVSFDLIRRWLEFRGLKVTYVQNFTDIDDKIIKRAAEVKISPQELAAKFTAAYFEVADKLNIKRADHYPKATEFVPPMIEFIAKLVDKGFAYQAGGDVYFSIKKLPDYGKLSHRDLDKLEAGIRVEVSERKQDPLDFALWKAAKEGEPSWDSPWGAGRPGWHIECSAMSMKYLGETLDIHGGGADLIFPHHENEIAQSEALTGRPFVKYWLHNGFINIDQTKMSKSLGNILTLKGIFARYEPMALRFYLLQTHYRSPINFSYAVLEEAQKGWRRLVNTCQVLGEELANAGRPEPGRAYDGLFEEFQREFGAALDDDFNSARAIAILFDLVREANRILEDYRDSRTPADLDFLGQAKRLLGEMIGVLGLEARSYSHNKEGKYVLDGVNLKLSIMPEDATEEEFFKLIIDREKARRSKNWLKADKIRKDIENLGYSIKDTKDGLTWSRKYLEKNEIGY